MDNRVFVIDGPVASSAGVTAGIDLALHLIADECGEALAAGVAEDLVVYLRRSHHDPELSPFLAHRRHVHSAVHRVQEAITTEPERDWTMPEMARAGHVGRAAALLPWLVQGEVLRIRGFHEARRAAKAGSPAGAAAREGARA